MKFLFFLPFILLLGCDENEFTNSNQSACDTNTPMETPWLLELKNSLQNCSCQVSLIQGLYQNQKVFFTIVTDPLCNSVNIPTLYNCKGIVIKTYTSSNHQEFNTEVTDYTVLHTCKNQ